MASENATPPLITNMVRRKRSSRAEIKAPVSEPIATYVPNKPYEAGPLPNSFVAISALKICIFSPKVATKKTTNITTYKSGRASAYSRPSRTVPWVTFFSWIKKSDSRIRNSATITNKYVVALIRNDGPVSKRAIRKPDSAGPTKRPALKLAEFKLTAFAISEWPTISEVNDWRIGASTAEEIPKVAAKKNTCQTCTWPVKTNSPSPSEDKAPIKLVAISNLRLFTRSASAPPCSEKKSTGAN